MSIKRIMAIGVTTLFAGLAMSVTAVAANATDQNNHQHQACSITGHGNSTVLTSTVKVANDPDSGNHGNWATDNFTRVTNISKSGDGWLVHIVDTGSFTTIPGGPAPESGVPLPNKSVTGAFTGVDNFMVSSDKAPTCDSVPSTINGAPGTSNWPLRYFCQGTKWEQGSWSWTYTINCAILKLDGNATVQWVNGSDGDTGDITAVLLLKLRLCHVHHTPKPCPSSASPSPSSASPSPASPSPVPSQSSPVASPSQSDTTSSSPIPVSNVGNSTNTGGSLPVTGTNLGIIFAVGVVLVLGGGGALFFLRRRATN